jgi:hypothetical protein
MFHPLFFLFKNFIKKIKKLKIIYKLFIGVKVKDKVGTIEQGGTKSVSHCPN